jgi:zinc protease
MQLLQPILVAALLAPLASAQTETRAANSVAPWAHESSDIPVDERIHFGAFENGLRYAWAKNSEPRDRVYIRLHVDVGSLAESDSEAGMAHFLEHMAFNGSEHFAAGTLVEWFQEHGMAFGADTNAHTGFSETVYKLDLPHNDEVTLREGLLVLRDFADGLLIDNEEVQAEKGVIDGEQRERDSVGYRTFLKVLDRLYAGTLYPSRLPIGTKPVRDEFDGQSVRTFYRRWYRPENMTLVMVGDLGERNPVALIEESFGSMSGPGTPVALEPKHGKPDMGELTFAIHEPEISGVEVSMSQLRPYIDEPDCIEKRRKDLARDVAQSMLNLRFTELVKLPETPFLQAKISSAGGLEIFDGGDLTVQCEPERWEEALSAAIHELRRALEYGFQEAELAEVRAEILRSLDEAVEREASAPSALLREAILNAIEDGIVPTDAATDRAVLAPLFDELTVEHCLDLLRDDWSRGATSVISTGSLDLKDPETAFRQTCVAAYAKEIEASEEIKSQPFAYTSDPDRVGEIVSSEHIEDLNLWLVEFANGVRLNLKPTDFTERQILVRAQIAGGRLALDEEGLAVGVLADAALSGGGLEDHSSLDLRRILAGKQVGLALGIEDDHLEFNGSTTADDLLLELELLCAYIAHPGYRTDGMVVVQNQLPLVFEQFKHTPEGPLTFEFLPAFLQGNPRLTLLGMSCSPSLEALQAVTMNRVRTILGPQLESGPLEVSLVGDFDPQEAILLAAQTLGTLATRGASLETEGAREGARLAAGLKIESTIDTQDAKVQVRVFYPTTDGYDHATRRHLFFLGQIVSDRLRLEVRERLGAAYAPYAASQASRIFAGLGALMIQASASPDRTEELVKACKDVAATIANSGVTAEEVQRLTEPLLNQLRDLQRKNGYWMTAIDRAQGDPDSLDEYRGLVPFYESLSHEALSKLAAQFLDPANASVLIVRPAPTAKAKE